MKDRTIFHVNSTQGYGSSLLNKSHSRRKIEEVELMEMGLVGGVVGTPSGDLSSDPQHHTETLCIIPAPEID